MEMSISHFGGRADSSIIAWMISGIDTPLLERRCTAACSLFTCGKGCLVASIRMEIAALKSLNSVVGWTTSKWVFRRFQIVSASFSVTMSSLMEGLTHRIMLASAFWLALFQALNVIFSSWVGGLD